MEGPESPQWGSEGRHWECKGATVGWKKPTSGQRRPHQDVNGNTPGSQEGPNHVKWPTLSQGVSISR